ncbi:MAG: hypothetical protein NVSMB44_44240 [Ktedonobacteraceae bacterium]
MMHIVLNEMPDHPLARIALIFPILVDIVHNFDFLNNPSHRAHLDRLFEEERALLQSGRIASNFAFIVYR